MSDTLSVSESVSAEATSASAESGSSGFSGRDATSDDIAAAFKSLEVPAGSDSSPEHPPTPTPPAAAPTTPLGSGSEVSPSTEGPIPFDRHKDILEHARVKARQEAEQSVLGRFKWAEGYDPKEVGDGVKLMRWMLNDPEGFEREWQRQRQRAQPAAPTVEEGELKAEDGTTVYSARQVQQMLDRTAKEMEERFQRTVDEKYGPLRQEAEAQKLSQKVDVQTKALLAQASQWPMFAELKKDIGQRMLANPALSFHEAYIESFRDMGMPKLAEQARTSRQGLVAEKTSAVTEAPGGEPGPAVDYTKMDTRDVARLEFERMAGTRRT